MLYEIDLLNMLRDIDKHDKGIKCIAVLQAHNDRFLHEYPAYDVKQSLWDKVADMLADRLCFNSLKPV